MIATDLVAIHTATPSSAPPTVPSTTLAAAVAARKRSSSSARKQPSSRHSRPVNVSASATAAGSVSAPTTVSPTCRITAPRRLRASRVGWTTIVASERRAVPSSIDPRRAAATTASTIHSAHACAPSSAVIVAKLRSLCGNIAAATRIPACTTTLITSATAMTPALTRSLRIARSTSRVPWRLHEQNPRCCAGIGGSRQDLEGVTGRRRSCRRSSGRSGGQALPWSSRSRAGTRSGHRACRAARAPPRSSRSPRWYESPSACR